MEMDGDIMGKLVQLKRSLTSNDLVRMRIPRRYWKVTFDAISDKLAEGATRTPKQAVREYLENMDAYFEEGVGVLFWGTNGTGKTSLSVVIAKEYRRRMRTVLFMDAADLKRLVIEKEHFDEDETFWQRANSVDVLVLDDLGKGAQDRTGFGARLIDELIRTRNSNQRVTIITTNMRPKQEAKGEKLGDVLKPSTMASLKEHVKAVHIAGADFRIDTARRLNRHG